MRTKIRHNIEVRQKLKEVVRVLNKGPNRYQLNQTTKAHLMLRQVHLVHRIRKDIPMHKKDILRTIHLSQVQLLKLMVRLKVTNKLKQAIKLDLDQTIILLDKITQDPNK